MAASRLLLLFSLFLAVSGAAQCSLSYTQSDESLVAAAESQDWSEVERLAKSGVDVNVTQADGMTAILWAAYHDNDNIIKVLLDSGADPNVENRYKISPLSLACQNGNESAVEYLLRSSADVNWRSNSGETALMIAARTGDLATIKLLLQHGADANASEYKGQTAIMWAAAEGNTEAVAALMDAKADWHRTLPSGFNAFLFAVRNGHLDTAAHFIRAGADVAQAMNPKNTSGRAPKRGTSPLILAIENGHFELAIALLEAGADPNDLRSGYSPSHMLTWVRKPNRGDGIDGDPPPRGSGNATSLGFARTLLKYNADVNLRLTISTSGRGKLDRRGATPFLMACMTADIQYMQLLLEMGADPTLSNATNTTPLLVAAGVGVLAPGEEAGTETEALEAVKILLALGADVNAKDDNGETAMHGAAYKSLPEMVQLLADSGAAPEIWLNKNKYGWTPIDIAEGYRPGNFKPAPETFAALERVLLAAGKELPKQRVSTSAAKSDNDY